MKRILSVLLSAAILAGCSAPNPKPFQEFSKAATGVGSATGKALAESTAQGRLELVESIDDPAAFNRLKLYFRASPGEYVWGNLPDGSWRDSTPEANGRLPVEPQSDPLPAENPENPGQWMNYYYKPQRISAQIDDYNRTFVQYSTLLAGLAGKDFLSDEEFKKMATDLNTHAGRIGREAGLSASSETALFSTSSLALFGEYLKARQKRVLRRAIQANQEPVVQYSSLGGQLTYLLSVPVQRSYNESFDRLKQHFLSATTEAGRRKQALAAVALNDSMIQRWELFAEMDRIYAGIPAAHQHLARAVEGEGGFGAVLELGQSLERLHKLYGTLKEANDKAAKAEAKTES